VWWRATGLTYIPFLPADYRLASYFFNFPARLLNPYFRLLIAKLFALVFTNIPKEPNQCFKINYGQLTSRITVNPEFTLASFQHIWANLLIFILIKIYYYTSFAKTAFFSFCPYWGREDRPIVTAELESLDHWVKRPFVQLWQTIP
jgi:hypothetical protein